MRLAFWFSFVLRDQWRNASYTWREVGTRGAREGGRDKDGSGSTIKSITPLNLNFFDFHCKLKNEV